MEDGTISVLTDIWTIVNTVMAAGSELMVPGMKDIQEAIGQVMLLAGGILMHPAGIRRISGFGLTEHAITSRVQDTWLRISM